MTETGPNDRIVKHPAGTILVVESDPRELSQTISTLQAAGYQVAGATRFEEAKRVLADAMPSLLIVGVRLGAYNGLHLIVRSRVDHPNLTAILTSDSLDPVLKAEAERQHAVYLLRPCADQDLLGLVARSLEASRASLAHSAVPPAGESPRPV